MYWGVKYLGDAGLRAIDELLFGRRRLQSLEHVTGRFSFRKTPAKPVSINPRVDTLLQPRRDNDERQQRDRVKPRHGPSDWKRRDHRRNRDEIQRQQDEAHQYKRSTLDEDVVKNETPRVIRPDNHEVQRQRSK